MKSRFSQNMQSNRRNRRILLSTVAVAVVVAAGVGGCYAAKQARIGVLRKQLAGLSTPLTLDYQRARYSPVTGVLKLHQVALSPAGTPQGASDNVWIIDTVRLEPLEGGLARAGRVALLDNRISNGFWASLKLAASADSPTAAHQAISDHNSKMLLGLKNKVFGDDPLVGNASWAYRLEDGGANGAQKLTLTDGLLENADGQLGLDTLQIDESATNSLGTAATAVQLDNLHFVGSDDASAPAAGNEDEESTSQQGQGENGAGQDGNDLSEGAVVPPPPAKLEAPDQLAEESAKDDPIKSLLKMGVSAKAVFSKPDENTSLTENLLLVAGPTADSDKPLLKIASITAVNKQAATNNGVDEASSTIKGLELAFDGMPGLTELPKEESFRKLSLDIVTKGSLNTNNQVGAYQFELAVQNQFRLDFQLSLGNLTPQLIEKLQAVQLAEDGGKQLQEALGQMMGITLNQASLTYDDKSLLRLLINDAARDLNLSVDQWVTQFAQKPNVLMARSNLPLLQQQWPAVEQFLRSPGSLSVALKPAVPVTVASLAMQHQSGGNQAVVDAIGLQLVATPAPLVEQQGLPSAVPQAQQPSVTMPTAPTTDPAPAPAPTTAAPKGNGGKVP